MESYDLLERDGWNSISLLIVTPYVTEEFFHRVLGTVKPKKLYILVDDGCRLQDMNMLMNLRRKGTTIYIAQASAAKGIVHAKVFHSIWQNKAESQTRQTLVVGSGNATGAAFENGRNAEVFVKTDMSKSPDALNMKEIFSKLRVAIEKAHSFDQQTKGGKFKPIPIPIELEPELAIATGTILRWPKIKVKPPRNVADSFDSWLQRGWLLSKYTAESDFLKVLIKLKTELPAGEVENRVNQSDWETVKTQTIRHTYIDSAAPAPIFENADDSSHDSVGNWKAKYFIQTQLGFWCSDACYEFRQREFIMEGDAIRREQLDFLRSLSVGSHGRKKVNSTYLAKLENLHSALGNEAENYLQMDRNELDIRFYQEVFDKKLDKDIDRSASEDFRKRFISGYDITTMPKFQNDIDGWRRFLKSVSEQLHFEGGKSRCQNLLFKTAEYCLGEVDDEAAWKLKKTWQEIVDDSEERVRDHLDSYHL